MPAKSRSQYRFMKAAEKGYIDVPGLSKEEAKEYTKENKGKKRYSKLIEKVKKQ